MEKNHPQNDTEGKVKTAYDIMKGNLERNNNTPRNIVDIPPKNRKVQEIEANIERICDKIKNRNVWA